MPFTKPVLPGTAVDFTGIETVAILPGYADTVAVISTGTWGPEATAKEYTSFSAFEADFGRDASPLRTAVAQAFYGGGVTGLAGAAAVIAYRAVGSSGAAASKVVQNTAGTPANALTLTALYKGTTGNELSYTIEDDPAVSGNDLLRVFFQGVEVERFSYVETDVVALAAAINAQSNYVSATETATGSALAAAASPVAFAGGDSGSTLTTADYSAALAALEFEEFGILAYDGVDDNVRAVIYAWLETMIDEYRPVIYVDGGAASETVQDALDRAAAVPAAVQDHVVTVGVGQYDDDLLGGTLSTAQLAPRVAGILAARGLASSLTFADLGGLHVVSGTGPTLSQLRTLRDNGVTAIRRVSSPISELKISQGVTTFTSSTTVGKPLDIFSDPRLIRVMDGFIRDMRAWGDDNIVGDTTVTDTTRAAVRGYAQGLIDGYIADGVVLPLPKPTVTTPIPSDPNLADTIPFEFTWTFARTTNNVIGSGAVR